MAVAIRMEGLTKKFFQRGEVVAEGTAREIVTRFGQQDLEEGFLNLARESRRARLVPALKA